MRTPMLLITAVLLAGCSQGSKTNPQPLDRFYYPSGIAFARPAGSSKGVLYVANADFDKRYDDGSVMAVDLDRVGDATHVLPPFGQAVPSSGPARLEDLNVSPSSVVWISDFAGEMGRWPLADGGVRLFVPSRSEGAKLQVIDAKGTALSCLTPSADGSPVDCGARAPSLDEHAAPDQSGKPAASQPYGVGISTDGAVYLTSLQPADSPPGSGDNLEDFAVHLNAADPSVDVSSFISLGNGGSNSVVVGRRFAFVSGRGVDVSSGAADVLVRLVDRWNPGLVGYPQIEPTYHVVEARGIALSSDETRLYLATRIPDTLLVLDVANADTSLPTLNVVAGIPLPAGPDEVKLIPRPGRGDLVAITCSGAGSLVLYDADLGQLVAEVPDIGVQPFAIALDPEGAGARLFVSDFGDGRVAVVDIPDLDRPQEARLVAEIGKSQTCIVRASDPSCQGVTP